jgi:hypothetical protein
MYTLMRSLSTSANNITIAFDASFIQNQPRGRFCQALRKSKKNVIKKISVRRPEYWGSWKFAHIVQKPFKRSRHQTPAVQNLDLEGVPSNQNTEVSSH